MRRMWVIAISMIALSGCLGDAPPPAPSDAAAPPTTHPQLFNETFDFTIDQVFATGAIAIPRDTPDCVKVIVASETTLTGNATATWEPRAPNTERLRLGIKEWGERPITLADVTDASPLRLAVTNLTIQPADEILIFVGLPSRETGAAIDQTATLTLELSYVGAKPGFELSSCTFGS